jgi:hypothetical protein
MYEKTKSGFGFKLFIKSGKFFPASNEGGHGEITFRITEEGFNKDFRIYKSQQQIYLKKHEKRIQKVVI